MGFGKLLGFGKKDKSPFKAPREVGALLNRISAESRENFPSKVRYKEIVREAARVQTMLDALIVEKEYAEEAARASDDISKKVEVLGAKIENNMQADDKGGGQDYVEKNIDYLERKSTRDKAKTLFTEFLEAIEVVSRACAAGTAGSAADLDSATQALVKTISELQVRFFVKYADDKEIGLLKENVLRKIYELNVLVRENAAVLSEKGLAGKAESGMNRVMAAATKLSEPKAGRT